MSTRSILYVDDRPHWFTNQLIEHSSADVLLLRFKQVNLPREHLEKTSACLSFTVDMCADPRIEALKLHEWCRVFNVAVPHYFLNNSEPAQRFAHRFARAFGLSAFSDKVLEQVRDKCSTKAALQRAGITTAHYAPVQSYTDIENFAQKYACPIVLKPRDGWSTIETYKVESLATVPDVFSKTLPLGMSGQWMVESFNKGREYECCALVAQGKVLSTFISYMPEAPLSIVQNQALNANITLSTEEEARLGINAKKLMQDIVNALGIDKGYVHTEIFIEHTGAITVSDVGARLAGCEIPLNHGYAYTFDMVQTLADIHMGKKVNMPEQAQCCVGDLLLPRKSGVVCGLPSVRQLEQFEGVLSAKLAIAIGQEIQEQKTSHANAGILHVQGKTVAEVESRMREVYSFFMEAYQVVASKPASYRVNYHEEVPYTQLRNIGEP